MDILVIIIVSLIVGSAIFYIVRQKKKGVKCIGCPDSKTCSGNCGSCGGCGCKESYRPPDSNYEK